MNILVAGVTSFLGRACADVLMKRGHTVYAMMRPNSPNRYRVDSYDKYKIVECDLADTHRLQYMNLPHMHACIDFAWAGVGVSGRMDSSIQEANLRMSLSLLTNAGLLGCRRFLFAGSQAEYGVTLEKLMADKCKYEPITEDYECDPVSEYGKAKLQMLHDATTLANLQMPNMEYIHMRYFSVYGAGDHATSLTDTCIRGFMQDMHVNLGPCQQMWNYLYIDDAARATADLLECEFCFESDINSHVVNIAADHSRRLCEYVEAIHEALGRRGSFMFHERQPSVEGTPYLVPDNARLRGLIGGFSQTRFEEGVREIEKMYSMRQQNK